MSQIHDEKPPQRPSARQLFLAFHTPGPRWPGALRAALALLIPGSIALLLGFEQEMLLIAAGGFTVIYGEGHPYRKRIRVMLIAGLLLALGATSGALIGEVVWSRINDGGSHWWLLLIAVFTTAIATAGAWIQNALRLPPPGSFFIVMVAGGSTMVARLGLDPVEVGLWALVGVATGIALGMLPALRDPHRPQEQAVEVLERAVKSYAEAPESPIARHHQAETALANAWFALSDAGVLAGGRVRRRSQEDLVARVHRAHTRLAILNTRVPDTARDEVSDTPNYVDLSRTAIPHSRPSITYRLYRSASLYSHATLTALKVLVAALACGVTGIALGLGRPDWAIVSALLTLQWGPDKIAGSIRGVHRLIGSIVGIGLYALFHLAGVEGFSLLIALAVCQFFAEIFVVRNYAICVIFTTPLALLMGNAITEPLAAIMVSRTAEVLLSIVFALLALWFFMPDTEARHHDRLLRRSIQAMGALLGRLLTAKPADALNERRDLQYELLSERRATQTLAADAPVDGRRIWPRHLRLQRAGYTLLDYCTTNDGRELRLGEIGELATLVREATADPDSAPASPTASPREVPGAPAADSTPRSPHRPDPDRSPGTSSGDDRGSAAEQ